MHVQVPFDPQPIFPALATAARSLAAGAQGGQVSRNLQEPLRHTAWLTEIEGWDALAFVDTCERCIEVPGLDHDVCRRITLAEWQLLFDFCCRSATGTAG
jgi:hypothetical protein